MSFSFASQQSLFQTPAQPSPFPSTSNFLQQQSQPQPFQQQQPQHQHHQICLFTKDNTPANFHTKWADLHPDSQKFLLQIQEYILEKRDESQRLDQCNRLYDSSVSNDAFDSAASLQELGGISTAVERENALIDEPFTVIKNMIRNTEIAVRTYMMLRSRFINMKTPCPSTSSTASQTSAGALVPSSSSQLLSTSTVPTFDFYSGIPKRPSAFLQQTISRFGKDLCECQLRVGELEQIISSTNEKSMDSDSSLLLSLPKVITNVHDFFIHVAAKVESFHQSIESMKGGYLANLRRRGDGHDPFLEADQRETAKLVVAARRIHPTLNSPAQPSTQVAGLFSSSATAMTSGASQTSVGLSAPASGSGFSFFNTPASSAPAVAVSSPSIFSNPSASVFSKPISPQPSPLVSAIPSLINSAQIPLLGANTPSLAPPPRVGGSLFSTPFASGVTAGLGANFSGTSKAKPKSRSSRR